jgi:hypothetical protein
MSKGQSKYLECGRCGLYFLLQDKVLVYIGATTDFPRRMLAHIDKKFNRIRFIPCDKDKRYIYERRLLAYFKPKYNLKYTGVEKERRKELVASGHMSRVVTKFLNGY